MDKELDEFKEDLFEFDIQFSPTYPFKEDAIEGANHYMKTRIPAVSPNDV